MLITEEMYRPDCWTVCRISGELDAFTVGQLRNSLARLYTSSPLVIDLSGVPFVDSAGLVALVGGIRRVRDHGGVVVLVCNRPTLVRVLSLTGVDRIVTVVGTFDDAVAAFEREEA